MNGRPAYKAFGQRIRVALAASRVSRSMLAEECGVSNQAIQKWCDGAAFPNSANLITFCRLTGCTVEWLMWPFEIDLKSTPHAPDGVHVKTLIRAVIEDLASDGVLRVAPVDAT